jgi:hypothetical protein
MAIVASKLGKKKAQMVEDIIAGIFNYHRTVPCGDYPVHFPAH